jgi:tryptophanase
MEPFRIKMVEPIKQTSRPERRQILEQAGYNLFQVPAEDVMIDLLTDSGTSAMSVKQWGAMLQGDDSYAGSRSWFRFQQEVRALTGFKHVVPAHQGRAAERILFSSVCRPGDVIPSNSHFDTTRANIEVLGATALDLLCEEGKQPAHLAPFKGNMDVSALEQLLRTTSQRVPLVMLTVTNNTGGGQPVSLANIRAVHQVCREHRIPLYLDACRFAENAWLIKQRESGQTHRAVRDIAADMFSLADGCTMSAKKDGLSNIGGFLCTNDPQLYQQEKNLLIISEGYVFFSFFFSFSSFFSVFHR